MQVKLWDEEEKVLGETRNKPRIRNTEDREGGLGPVGQVDGNVTTSTKEVCDINEKRLNLHHLKTNDELFV